MPFATRKNANTTQSAVLKPWVRPYHGTRMAAATKVSANISALAQMSGGWDAFTVDWAMLGRDPYVRGSRPEWRSRDGSSMGGGITYHARPGSVGLASILSILRRWLTT